MGDDSRRTMGPGGAGVQGAPGTGEPRDEPDSRSPLTVLFLLLAAAAVQFMHYYPKLPDVLVTHFNVSGQPDGWSEKQTFFIIYGVVELAMVAGALLFARFGPRIPSGALNIPNREYWLAPERRAATLSFVWTQILWVEVATLAFLVLVAEVMFRVNVAPGPPALTHDFFIVLAAFLAVIAWLTIRILARFRAPGVS